MDIPLLPKRALFALFFVSGFCGLLYQIVWVRLALAAFGVITPVISVVISVFMLGLALGSWAGGRFIGPVTGSSKISAIFFYAITEFCIGVGAFAVPYLFGFSQAGLLHLGDANSASYLILSALAIALSILPWCFFMGATFPVVMAYVREYGHSSETSFSFLYLANVIGASMGALVTATVLVEEFGFWHTLWMAGIANFAIAAAALSLGRSSSFRHGEKGVKESPASTVRPPRSISWVRSILFATGLASLAMEVVWTRTFTPIVGAVVYSFAALLVVYLIATWLGSFRYRRDVRSASVKPVGQILALLALAALLPVVVNDPRLLQGHNARIFLALASIFPLCALLGYLTPRLIDDYAAGNPRTAGRAYALNVLGCIVGPLLASYILLPLFGASLSLVILAIPFLAFAIAYRFETGVQEQWCSGLGVVALLVCALFVSVSYENPCTTGRVDCEIRRDYAATVVSTGRGMAKRLLVNGIGITELTPITKWIAHLPLAMHRTPPESSLVICFGMGTTYRSLLSWNIPTTAVELVPSVRDAFPYYFSDAQSLLENSNSRVVIDDGRRFLNRTDQTYDVIVIDPPPPVEAAGSSLLYSREFNLAVKRHLKPGGIFQSWFPGGEPRIEEAIARSLVEVFPYVKVYHSLEGWGVHFLASMEPFDSLDAAKMLSRMPESAKGDLAEWTRQGLRYDVEKMLSNEFPVTSLLGLDPSVEIDDDHPYNEYYLLRRSALHR